MSIHFFLLIVVPTMAGSTAEKKNSDPEPRHHMNEFRGLLPGHDGRNIYLISSEFQSRFYLGPQGVIAYCRYYLTGERGNFGTIGTFNDGFLLRSRKTDGGPRVWTDGICNNQFYYPFRPSLAAVNFSPVMYSFPFSREPIFRKLQIPDFIIGRHRSAR